MIKRRSSSRVVVQSGSILIEVLAGASLLGIFLTISFTLAIRVVSVLTKNREAHRDDGTVRLLVEGDCFYRDAGMESCSRGKRRLLVASGVD